MKLMTLNTWGTYGPYEKRWNYLVEALRPLEPNILFLQEVINGLLPDKIKHKFSYPYFSASYEAGLAIFSKIPISLYKNYKYKVISPHEAHDRRALLVKTKIADEPLILANTHLAWKAQDGETRRKQVEELLGQVHEAGLPAVLAGDFNDVPESVPIQQIKGAGFKDIFEGWGEGDGVSWDNRNPFIQSHEIKFPDRRIDFLFMDERLAKIHPPLFCHVVFHQSNAEGIYPSDHYGVMAEIKP